MVQEVVMLALSPTMETGTIVKWHKKEGDRVARDEIVVEILTDKITVEVPSAFSGTLARILVQEGEVVSVEQELAVLLRENEDPAALEVLEGEHPERRQPREGEHRDSGPGAPGDVHEGQIGRRDEQREQRHAHVAL